MKNAQRNGISTSEYQRLGEHLRQGKPFSTFENAQTGNWTVGEVAYVHTTHNDLMCGDTTVVKVARTGSITLANGMRFDRTGHRGDPKYGFTLHKRPVDQRNSKMF